MTNARALSIQSKIKIMATEQTFGEMIWIPGGAFLMGSNDFYPEERPVHKVAIDGFWMDAHPVTNTEFERFVNETGYMTIAERDPDPADYPGVNPELLIPGSLVFRRTARRVNLNNFQQWWTYLPGASWKNPEGRESDLRGRENHPVVHIAYEDAKTYAKWAGKSLPSEAEWEFAARGGLEGAAFVWGDEFAPGGKMMANTWQGEFPWQNLKTDGYEGTSPTGAFPANGYGLFDMAGNVWEWTQDKVTNEDALTDEALAKLLESGQVLRVVKGGTAKDPAKQISAQARYEMPEMTKHPHIGFRYVITP